MEEKRAITGISYLREGEQFDGSQGTAVALRRASHRLRLTGHIARRKSLPLGITWDTELPGFGLRKRKSGHLTWVVKHRPRGVQRMVTLGSAGVAAGALSAPAARAEARRLLVQATLADLPSAPEQRKVPTFADYAEEFWLDYSPHWKASTRRTSRSRIDRQLVARFGELPVDGIERADINRWRDSMAGRGGSFNRSIPIMSVMMQYAEKLGYRANGSNPCRGVARFKRDLPDRFLSADEYRRLGRVLTEHDGANPFVVPALLMLIYTGARVSEIATLRWHSVQVPRLALPDSKTGPKTIYLNAQAIAVLDRLQRRGDDELVFQAMHSEKPINLGEHWAKIRRTAALPDVRLHDLRHSFASVAIAQGIPLATIGKMLGHALPETTARYAHLADEVISQSADRICSSLATAMGIAA
jgi:integrase